MKKVIVLGANGQLGKTIKDYSPSEVIKFHFFSRNDLDIVNKNSLKAIFKDSGFKYCINCAAYTDVEGAETNTEDAFLINAEGAKNIAEVCNTYHVKLIHISTDYVFDGKKNKPYTVTDQTNPINQYGKSKLQGELFIQEQLKPHYIIRTSWLYSLHGKNFLKTIINKIEDDASLNITTEQEGTPTSCIDLADFIIHLIDKDSIPYGIYNFSANGNTTWYGFAKEVAKNYNSKKTDSIKPSGVFKTLAKRPKYSVFDLSKTERIYKEINTWQKSVENIVKAYKG
ncbi:dTDP-4-dehydrorhamnose reductase [Winogradskyella thalassocola]|uniref:dTDP-4-dehydrorhamnose reductase n=1 Tax=Winogradskyella thalassocola TaxID=262004 RepID=A0A1G7WUF7_9FLAO|nr:dTDP-4-dehydrorhamnose reductase [Winogradskyella thalassocola]SDG75595.1 dTDP-4-dehydrorhamnose reductase [Winogradskyella thalassocola]